jgi:hypothetical protein
MMIVLWLYPFVLWIVTKLSINMSFLPPSPLLLDVPPWLVHLAPGPVECWVSAQGYLIPQATPGVILVFIIT